MAAPAVHAVPTSTSVWRLRPLTRDDEPQLRRIDAATRQGEIGGDWSAVQREQFLDLQFRARMTESLAPEPGSERCLLEQQRAGGPWQAVGLLWLQRRRDTVQVMDLALLPEARGRGLGTAVLQHVMDEAAASRRTVSTHVDEASPARRVFERLGFVPAGPVRDARRRWVWQAPG